MTTHQTTHRALPPHYRAYEHTQQQLQARYNLRITYADYEHVCAQLDRQGITAGHPAVIRETGARWVIRWRVFGTPVVLVYEADSAVIVTALPDPAEYDTPRPRKRYGRLRKGRCRQRQQRKRQRYDQ